MRLETPNQPFAAAIRGVRRTVRYTLAFVWTLALGVAANAAMFWIVDSLLSRSQ
jgi:hypothetical protein